MQTAPPWARTARASGPREAEYEKYRLPPVPRQRRARDGTLLNREQIEQRRAENKARLAELQSREKLLLAGLERISPKLAHRRHSDRVLALVLEAQRNDAIAQFVEILVAEGEKLSAQAPAVTIVDRISELVRQSADRERVTDDAFRKPGRGRGKRRHGSLARGVVEMAAVVLAGVASGAVESLVAERLAIALEPVRWDGYTSKRTLDEELESRFRVVESREREPGGGDSACYDNARRLVLVRGADGELRPLCSWPD